MLDLLVYIGLAGEAKSQKGGPEIRHHRWAIYNYGHYLPGYYSSGIPRIYLPDKMNLPLEKRWSGGYTKRVLNP